MTALVHRIVLAEFVGPKPPGLQRRHLDGDKDNNRLDNLEYGTAKENADDRERHGTTSRGEKSHLAKLTAPQVIAIRAALANGARGTDLAGQYGTTRQAITEIRQRRCWKHL